MNPPIGRRQFCQGLLAVGAAGLAGCTKANHYWLAVRPNRAEINILLWDGYFSEDIVARFERDYDIRVNVTIFSSNEDLYEILTGKDPARPGPYDLAMPSDFMAVQLQAEGRLATMTRNRNDTKFTYLTHLNPADNFNQPGQVAQGVGLDRSYNTKSDPNNDYVIPYIWGSTGIGYNSEQVGHLPMSWSALFEPSPQRKRKIALMDDAHFALGSALIYQIAKKYRGSTLESHEVAQKVATEFATAGEPEIAAAGELIKQLGDEVVCINSDHIPELLATEVADYAIAWSGDIAVAMLRGRVDPPANEPPTVAPNLNIRISLPEEGVIVFRDCFVVPRQRTNQGGAEQFVNFLFDPAIAGAVTNYCCYATTVKSATPNVDPQISNSAAYFIHPYRDKNIFLENGRVRETDAIYTKVWEDVKRAFPPGIFAYPPQPRRDIAPASPYPVVPVITVH